MKTRRILLWITVIFGLKPYKALEPRSTGRFDFQGNYLSITVLNCLSEHVLLSHGQQPSVNYTPCSSLKSKNSQQIGHRITQLPMFFVRSWMNLR